MIFITSFLGSLLRILCLLLLFQSLFFSGLLDLLFESFFLSLYLFELFAQLSILTLALFNLLLDLILF
jgi:hypothetical protein